MVVYLVILSAMLPILTISAFIIGYNINAPRKILVKPKKRPKTEDEIMLERIENAHI